jgi:hypothetical protein
MQTFLEVAKKNWVSITFGVLALLAVIAVPTFVNSQRDALQKTLDDQKAVHESLKKLLDKSRHEPTVSLDPDATAPEMPRFPNVTVIDYGQKTIKHVQDQSLLLKDQAVRMNVRQPLVAGALPTTRDPFQFQQIYLKQFTTVIPAALQSATPPTDEEIKARADKETERLTKEAPHDAATGDVFNKDALQNQINQMLGRLPEEMRQEAATKHRMYVAPTAMSLHPDLAGGKGVNVAPSAQSIWLAQVGLWLQQDLVAAIQELNRNSKLVETSPVKAIVGINISPNLDLYVVPAAAAGATPGAAQPGAGANGATASSIPTNGDADPIPKDYTVSPTGRTCNGIFDVVSFTVVLNVQATDLGRVIQAIERDRLITVTQTDVQAVNSAAMRQEGYYFGRNPVVTLTMKCEADFLRDWTRPLMPKEIKQYLNVLDPGQQPDQQAQPTQALNQ